MATGGVGYNEDLDSEFDTSEGKGRCSTWRNDPLSSDKLGPSSSHQGKLPSKEILVQERDKEEWRSRRYHLLSMDAYSRHKTLINQYLLTVGHGIERIQRSKEKDRTDYDVLKDHHKFLWDDDTITGSAPDTSTWEQRLARSYFEKLFKEYALSDLSKYKENKIALRWRTEQEVIDSKGQFVCGNKVCLVKEGLQSWEVNFAYIEHRERKNALVKLRLCPKCSKKLNYHHKRNKWKKKKLTKELKRKQSKQDHHHHHHSKRRKNDETDTSSNESSIEDDTLNKVGISNDDVNTPDTEKVWTKSAKELVDKTEDEEFDDYFKDMLL